MALLVGIDESGYGPTLGPLIVSATLWRVPPKQVDADFWDLLAPCVRRPTERTDGRLAVGDSKVVFDRKKGLATLERPVLAFAKVVGLAADTLTGLLGALDPGFGGRECGAPWYRESDTALPRERGESAFQGAAARLAETLARVGVGCAGLMSQIVTEEAFNRRVAGTRNKAAVLVEQVLRLLSRAAERAAESDVYARIDRLGGRSDYRALLMAAFPERHVHVLEVSATRSRYRLASARSDWYVEFVVDADRDHLPVALASMLAKYVRELLMEQFNSYWRHLLPDLRPTAGYYTDARRFLAEIRPVLPETGLAPERFVRAR